MVYKNLSKSKYSCKIRLVVSMINSYKDFKKFLLEQNGKSLLIHACCAPCSSAVLELLNQYFKITIYFYNPNIEPYEEFNRRYDELIGLIKKMNLNVEVIKGDYDEAFKEISKGLEMEPERGKRCYKCYRLRMVKTAQLAKELGFDFFTTTLSISPHKNSLWINEIGYILEDEINVKFLYSDFKKEDGYKKSIELSKKYDLYRQDYCGCIYSKKNID